MKNRNEPKGVVDETPLAGITTARTHGHDAMTEKQAVELRQLAEEAGEPFDTSLNRGQAEERIEALKKQLGRS
ncbi:DUF3072 domain-containing protein [Tranquillimonas alkanivorans]|uniref:DUF3072 domain-containing protein n=1 Tax=Tranquillimonas alkanivorans TaxID=441119 RepID=A0A1I5T0C8_9RHOB|nr:DUF3072 domain-containing protein [Tranquillimonas alkanivorans]SFP76127.1 Protein of unknown function [Tranquillimonas alkanivorans]